MYSDPSFLRFSASSQPVSYRPCINGILLFSMRFLTKKGVTFGGTLRALTGHKGETEGKKGVGGKGEIGKREEERLLATG
jgi:hypothetical protein